MLSQDSYKMPFVTRDRTRSIPAKTNEDHKEIGFNVRTLKIRVNSHEEDGQQQQHRGPKELQKHKTNHQAQPPRKQTLKHF